MAIPPSCGHPPQIDHPDGVAGSQGSEPWPVERLGKINEYSYYGIVSLPWDYHTYRDMCLQQQTADVNSCHSKRYSIPVNLSLKVVSTEMAKKVCPRLRELAPTVRGGITNSQKSVRFHAPFAFSINLHFLVNKVNPTHVSADHQPHPVVRSEFSCLNSGHWKRHCS